MEKDFSTLKEIIDFAMEKEIEAEALYVNLGRQAKTDRSSSIFEELAAEEKKHYESLKNLDAARLDAANIKDIPDLKISDHLHEISLSDDMTYQDTLVFAMKSEEHSHKLYSGLAKHTGDADIKKILELLAMQEARHKLRLETEYDDFILTQD